VFCAVIVFCEYLSQSFQYQAPVTYNLYQTSCAHTPLENGITKCQNHHFIETTYILLIHSDIPFCFLGDVLIVCYHLIDGMSSDSWSLKLHSILFSQYILHFLTPYIFGSTCSVNNLVCLISLCVFLGHAISNGLLLLFY
jgi:hypothetical protein